MAMIEQSAWMTQDEAVGIIKESNVIQTLLKDCCIENDWCLEEMTEYIEHGEISSIIDTILERFVQIKRVFQTDVDGKKYYSFRLNISKHL